MNKLYSGVAWENFPSEKTPLNAHNLLIMGNAIDAIDNRVIEMDATKVNKEVANSLVQSWSMDESTGIITITHLDGSKDMFDLNIEKIPVDFKLSEDGILTMTTDDGSKFTANIGAMIPVLTFEDSDEIVVSVSGSGVNKTYSFSVKDGSITEGKLQTNYLANIKTEVAKAQKSEGNAQTYSKLAQSYAVGSGGAREDEATDNAKYYCEHANELTIGKANGQGITFSITADNLLNVSVEE